MCGICLRVMQSDVLSNKKEFEKKRVLMRESAAVFILCAVVSGFPYFRPSHWLAQSMLMLVNG